MDVGDLLTKLENLINECDVDTETPFSLQAALDANDVLPLDSMGLFDLGMKVEDTLGVRLSDEEMIASRHARFLFSVIKERMHL